jgi:radical SAM peptide maturase (CXXX-repeat target family)
MKVGEKYNSEEVFAERLALELTRSIWNLRFYIEQACLNNDMNVFDGDVYARLQDKVTAAYTNAMIYLKMTGRNRLVEKDKNGKEDDTQFQDRFIQMYPEYIADIPDEDDGRSNNVKVVQSLTFQVTDACNLGCTYCYQINKGKQSMSFETAKKVIDDLLPRINEKYAEYIDPDITKSIILEFIGGEPFMEVELVSRIVDYFRLKAIETDSIYSDYFITSFSTNGTLYREPAVQRFLARNRDAVSLSVTVDGTKEVHDSCRRFLNGEPTYEIAHEAAMDWAKKTGHFGSKITLAPGNVGKTFDCLMQMLEDGYHTIHINTVFEEGWTVDHARTMYYQLKKFTDEFLKEHNADDYEVSILREENTGEPVDEADNKNWCGGTGAMLAVSPDGKLYPCLRYMPSSIGDDQPAYVIGDVDNGIATRQCERDRINCMDCINRRSQSDDQCFYCPIGGQCSWCSAYNYQVNGTPDKRVKFSCDMHKARSMAVVYFWNTWHKRQDDGKVKDMWIPKEWALPIVGEDEYNMLANLTKELGGFVNEDITMVRLTDKTGEVKTEVLKRG